MKHKNDTVLREIVYSCVPAVETTLNPIVEAVLRIYHPSGKDVAGKPNGVVPTSQMVQRIQQQLDRYLPREGKIIVRTGSSEGIRGRRKIYRRT